MIFRRLDAGVVPPVEDFYSKTALGRQVSNRCKTTF
jgi:hypothetical protein